MTDLNLLLKGNQNAKEKHVHIGRKKESTNDEKSSTGFKINIGKPDKRSGTGISRSDNTKENPKTSPILTSALKTLLEPEQTAPNPTDELSALLNSEKTEIVSEISDLEKTLEVSPATNNDIPDTAGNANPNGEVSMANPTLENIAKFVFEEQPDSSTEEITEKFSQMLDNLSVATGTEVPRNLADCLKFIKEHAFLADILKPEYIGTLVTAMRKSYGFVVNVQGEKAQKRKQKDEKTDKILTDLDGIDFIL